jgi:hypothetical protein
VVNSAIKLKLWASKAQTTAKKVRLNPIYDMRGGAGGTVDVFGWFESQIQQRSDFFLSGLAAEPTDQPDMSDQRDPLGSGSLSCTDLVHMSASA